PWGGGCSRPCGVTTFVCNVREGPRANLRVNLLGGVSASLLHALHGLPLPPPQDVLFEKSLRFRAGRLLCTRVIRTNLRDEHVLCAVGYRSTSNVLAGHATNRYVTWSHSFYTSTWFQALWRVVRPGDILI